MLKEYKKRKADSKAFKEEVRKITLQERRKAYKEEALIKAKEEGKALARRVPKGKRIADGLTSLTKAGVKKIITPPKNKQGRNINPYTSTPRTNTINMQKPVGFEFM
jgi:hypothetical protein